jgi:hypothetical protein
MSDEQYSAEFLTLLRYAPHLIPNEETKPERFLDGLSTRIHERIAFLEITAYFKMVHTATIVEKEIRKATADYINRKRPMSMGVPPPPPPLKRYSEGSSLESFGKRNTSASQASNSVPQCNN